MFGSLIPHPLLTLLIVVVWILLNGISWGAAVLGLHDELKQAVEKRSGRSGEAPAAIGALHIQGTEPLQVRSATRQPRASQWY